MNSIAVLSYIYHLSLQRLSVTIMSYTSSSIRLNCDVNMSNRTISISVNDQLAKHWSCILDRLNTWNLIPCINYKSSWAMHWNRIVNMNSWFHQCFCTAPYFWMKKGTWSVQHMTCHRLYVRFVTRITTFNVILIVAI